MQIMQVVAFGLSFLVTQSAAMAAVLGMNLTQLRGKCAQKTQGASYGKNSCRCIGIDNLKGYYATQVNFHHVQYSAETGASCAAWDDGSHPECKGAVPPQWCKQEWCYVDPCSCDIETPPKVTAVGLEFQGTQAYYSYATCGGMDFFSSENKNACINQKSAGACAKKSNCAWDGKDCLGKELVETCKVSATKDATVHGEEDCRCIGLGGKGIGKSFMHISEKEMIAYSPNVGATCGAWEDKVHPDCLKEGGVKPSWCSAKWCFVDPCKCKSKVPPKAVMAANKAMRFQGKTAYWSYSTCGSEDTWIDDHKGQYCPSQKSQAECSKMDKCAWNGKECLGKALVNICAKQESTGVLGVESPLESGTISLTPFKALILLIGAVSVAQAQ